MRRDEDAFLRGQNIVDSGGNEMTPCNESTFFEYVLHEETITEQPPYAAASRPFSRMLFCNKCGSSTNHTIQENTAVCSVCSTQMEVKASTAEHKGDDKPYRIGDSVQAKPGTKLHRYLSEFYSNSSLSLKVHKSTIYDSAVGYDYLVAPVAAMRNTWVQNQLLPVRHEEVVMEDSLRSTGYVTTLDRIRVDKYFRFRDVPNGLAVDQYSVRQRLPDSVEIEGRALGQIGSIPMDGAKQYKIEILEHRFDNVSHITDYVEAPKASGKPKASWADQMEEELEAL